MDYRREIDGLRALAVLPVILFHAGFEIFSGGFVGVDVFFVISGYLITTIILEELVQGKFSIGNFYERRARRILPALYLVMLVCIPFAWFWLSPSEMKDFLQSLVAVSVFTSNILFWRESGYFDTAAELKPLSHTWSLAVEEQFYLLFPLFLILFWRLCKRWIFVAVGLVSVASLVLAQWAAYARPVAAFYLLPTRSWELLAGALVAFYLSKPNRKEMGKAACEVCGWLGVALILYAVFSYSKATPFPGLHALIPAIGAVLIILFASQKTAVGKFVGNKAFVGVGLISYSAYLWHQPLFAFLKHSKLPENAYSYGALIGLTLVLALLTWKYVESPFRKKDEIGRAQILKFSSALALFFIALGVSGNKFNDFENREHNALLKDLTYDTPKPDYPQCNNDLSNKEPKLYFCMGFTEAPNALLIGDSHADDKFYGIEKNVRGLDWMLLGNYSCPPLLNVKVEAADGTECTELLSKLFSYIDETSSIKVVVLSFSHSYPLEKLIAADHIQAEFDQNDQVLVDLLNPKAAKIDAFYAGLRRAVSFLVERNIKTVISLDVPELEFFPSDCLEGGVNCTFIKDKVLQRQQLHRAMAHNLSSEFKGVLVFDPLPLFCGNYGDTCSIFIDGRSLYRDSHHLSDYGSLKYGEAFSIWFSKSLN